MSSKAFIYETVIKKKNKTKFLQLSTWNEEAEEEDTIVAADPCDQCSAAAVEGSRAVPWHLATEAQQNSK